MSILFIEIIFYPGSKSSNRTFYIYIFKYNNIEKFVIFSYFSYFIKK